MSIGRQMDKEAVVHVVHNGILVNSEVAQLCPTLCDPMDCSLPGFSVHGIFQAIVLEWIAISSQEDLSDQGTDPRLLHCRQILFFKFI